MLVLKDFPQQYPGKFRFFMSKIRKKLNCYKQNMFTIHIKKVESQKKEKKNIGLC